MIGFSVVVTSDREKEVLFTTPIDPNEKQMLVTGPNSPPIAGLEELSGKEVYVSPITVYYDSLRQLNDALGQRANHPSK